MSELSLDLAPEEHTLDMLAYESNRESLWELVHGFRQS